MAPSPQHPAQEALARIIFGLAVPLAAQSCAKDPKRTEVPGPKITKVSIEGEAELRESQILDYVSLRPSQWLGESYYYFPGSEALARKRITELFRAEGYYEAQVAPLQVVVSKRDRPVARQRAQIKIRIDAGAPTRIRSIRWEQQSLKAKSIEKISPKLRHAAELEVNQRFSISQFNLAKEKLRAQMQREGYPDAQVQESAVVDKESRSAQLKFELIPGAQVEISQIEVKGISGVPKRYVHQLAAGLVHRRYDPEGIQAVESSIYALGIFSSVHTQLVHYGHPTRRRLLITLSARDPAQLALGASAHFDSTLWSQLLGLRYQHNNLAHRLIKLKLQLAAGWAEMPVENGTWHSSPLVELNSHISMPSLRVPDLRWFAQLSTRTEPREGYEFWRAGSKLGAIYNYGKHASVSLSYNASWLSIYTFSDRRQLTTQGINELEGHRPFLSFLEAQFQAFSLDQRLAPKEGLHGLFTYQWATRFLGSQSEYHRIVPELRAYWNPISWLVMATRGRIGFILPFGQRPGARIDQRFYLGGVGSVRGWPLRALSPFVRLCPSGQECKDVPIGGNSEFLANLELRFNVWRKLDLIAFADAGDVESGISQLRPTNWMYTSGTGLRYVTPIGAIRLDLGFQLNHDLTRFRPTRSYAIHLALGDSF